MASMMAKVKVTMMASCKVKAATLLDGILQLPSWWSTVMAVMMEHNYGHHDGTLLWPWPEKTLLWASPRCNIKNTGGDGENPKRSIDMFETAKSGSHQSIEVALDCFVVFRSTVDGIKVLWRSWNRRAFILWALEKTNMLQESQN